MRSDTDVVPTEWPEEYSFVEEYSVSTWVRYVLEAPVPWQLVFRLTSNEPEVLNDITHHGDRVLTCFYNIDHLLHFSTYTAGVSDTISHIAENYKLPEDTI